MLQKLLSTMTILLTLLLSLPVDARSPRNERRDSNQSQRIEKGVSSGQINKREAARLERGQNRVDKAQEHAMSDGDLSKKEKVVINKMQNKQSKRIYRQSNDGKKVSGE